jgi:uncharacterized membrane protein YkvA (DUF1232 family)
MADEKRRRIPVRARLDEDDDDDLVGPRTGGASPRARDARDDEDEDDAPAARPRPRPRRSPRAAARRGRRLPARGDVDLRGLVRQIPHFLRLLWGLARDPRVSVTDKAIVVAAIAYAALPEDLIPDWVPGLGEVEDVLLVALALSRLLANADPEVIDDWWDGDDETLDTVLELLDGATQVVPGPIRGLLVGRR